MKLTLCGSTRFREAFVKTNADLTLKGHIVYSLGMFAKQASDVGKPDENPLITDHDKVILDLVHLNKIEHSDGIVVLNVDGYIGDSTYREMLWAWMRHKDIFVLSPEFSRALPSNMRRHIEPFSDLEMDGL